MPSPAAFIVATPAALVVAVLAAVAGATSADAACRPGAAACPVVVRMAPGTDTITLTGVVAPGEDCCAFAMRARAGQVMTWRIAGPAIRTTIRYPDGTADGPGLPATIPLPESGTYVFGVRPNLMAEGASGPFSVTFTIR